MTTQKTTNKQINKIKPTTINSNNRQTNKKPINQTNKRTLKLTVIVGYFSTMVNGPTEYSDHVLLWDTRRRYWRHSSAKRSSQLTYTLWMSTELCKRQYDA